MEFDYFQFKIYGHQRLYCTVQAYAGSRKTWKGKSVKALYVRQRLFHSKASCDVSW